MLQSTEFPVRILNSKNWTLRNWKNSWKTIASKQCYLASMTQKKVKSLLSLSISEVTTLIFHIWYSLFIFFSIIYFVLLSSPLSNYMMIIADSWWSMIVLFWLQLQESIPPSLHDIVVWMENNWNKISQTAAP